MSNPNFIKDTRFERLTMAERDTVNLVRFLSDLGDTNLSLFHAIHSLANVVRQASEIAKRIEKLWIEKKKRA